MKHSWPVVPLGEVVLQRKEFITIDDFLTYKRCRVQLHAKGAVLRDEVEGTRIKTKSQQVCKAGEFLVAEIDAKVGGYGIVPPELDGAIVSSHYFLFTINRHKIDRRFLRYFIKTPIFRDQVGARGSTNYAAIRPHQVLSYQIPLPSLHEQRRIVAKIERLTAKIEEARGLRGKSLDQIDALRRSLTASVIDKAPIGRTNLEEVSGRITKGESPSWQGYAYQEEGPVFIRSENVLWGSIDLSNPVHIPEAFHEKLVRSQLVPGDVLINLVGASIGRACIVPQDIVPANVNQAVAVISPRQDSLDGGYLLKVLLGNNAQATLHGGKVDTARANISLTDLRRLRIPLPHIEEQRRIVAYLDGLQAKLDRLKALQEQSAAELDALLPSVLDKAFRGEF